MESEARSDLARIADALEHLCGILDRFVPLMEDRLLGPKFLRRNGKVDASQKG